MDNQKPEDKKEKPDLIEVETQEPEPTSAVLDRLRQEMSDDIVEAGFELGVPVVRVKPDKVVDVCRFLKEDEGCGMTLLSSLCGVDMSKRERPEPRFDVVYHMFSIDKGEQMTVKASVAEDGAIPSVTPVWRTAGWHEREAYDMFGITFSDHPDLRRILMPFEFDAFPLRKDFPLEGREKDHGYWRRPEDENRYRYATDKDTES